MSNKDYYNIKDTVWIHLGGSKLTEGRVVEVFNLSHLNESYTTDQEFYVIELKTEIENIFEVRNFDQISPDSKGPIMAFRNINAAIINRMLNKVGLTLPVVEYADALVDSSSTTDLVIKPKRKYYNNRKKKQ